MLDVSTKTQEEDLERKKQQVNFDTSATTVNRMDKSTKKSVSFQSNVLVREYPIILGDNPSPMTGPPLSIDWKFLNETSIAIHQPNSNGDDIIKDKPRKRCGMERQHLLVKLGYTIKDIKIAMKSIKKEQRKRLYTEQQVLVQTQISDHMEMMTDSIRRNLLNLPTKKKSSSSSNKLSSRQQQKQLQQQVRRRKQ